MIYFFYGKDVFLVSQEEQSIRKEHAQTHDITIVDFTDKEQEVSVGSLRALIGTSDLFASQRMIVVRNIFAGSSADEQARMRDFLDEWQDSSVTLVFAEGSAPRKNARLFTWLTKNTKVQECKAPAGSGLTPWVRAYIRSHGGMIDPDAAAEIAGMHPPEKSLAFMARLCDVLSTYAGDRAITVDDVGLMMQRQLQADIFATIETVSSGQKKKALQLLRAHTAAGDDPHYIFSMYVYHVRTLLAIAGMYHDQGLRDKNTIAKEAGLHPFVVQKSMQVLQRCPKKKLLRALTFLKDADHDIKRGKADVQLTLERFIWIF